jgi:hypothetical protein
VVAIISSIISGFEDSDREVKVVDEIVELDSSDGGDSGRNLVA